MSFSLVTCPSTGPLLHCQVRPFLTASLSFSMPAPDRRGPCALLAELVEAVAALGSSGEFVWIAKPASPHGAWLGSDVSDERPDDAPAIPPKLLLDFSANGTCPHTQWPGERLLAQQRHRSSHDPGSPASDQAVDASRLPRCLLPDQVKDPPPACFPGRSGECR